MPVIVCDRCGREQTSSIFEPDPRCEACGATDFHAPADDD